MAKAKTIKFSRAQQRRVDEVRLEGRDAGYVQGRSDARREFWPDQTKAPHVSEWIRNVEALHMADAAVVGVFITDTQTHAQQVMPLRLLKDIAGQLKRLGY